MDTENNRINLLPEHLIDQIKAGEVVERPANVLKELLENSIDAGSSKIKLTLIESGLDLIAIEDNGNGMYFDELPYAFCRHATSKINSFEDIYKLNTFGFRGEALASISSVSRISCHSAPKDDLTKGSKFVIHGALTKEHSNYTGRQSGTSIYVKDLFYNTPVRLKFIKSSQSEKNALKRVINSFLINYPHVEFMVIWDDNDPLKYRAKENTIERIQEVFKKRTQKLVPEVLVEHGEYQQNKCKLIVSDIATKGYAGKQQFLFINNRLFVDKKIHQVILRNMEKYWPLGMTGNYVLQITLPENEIDVNVHPNKTIIKFLKLNEVISLVSATTKKLISNNEDKRVSHDLEFNQEEVDQDNLNRALFSGSTSTLNLSQLHSEIDNTAISHGQSSLFSNQEELTITPLGQNIFFLNHIDRGPYFLDAKNAIEELFNKVNLDNMTPLLICEPISCATKQTETEDHEFLESINTVGFELDRLDETTCVLRSISHIFEDLPYVKICQNIIQGTEVTENISLTSADIQKTINIIDFYEMINIGIAKKVSPSKIKRLLK